jgi:hypothetical protein
MSDQTNKPTLPDVYMLADRKFHQDDVIRNYLKSEIWNAIESADQNRIDTTSALVTTAIESNGANVVEAAELHYYQQKEKRTRRRVGS